MQNGIHFISGLPRAGSTLLAALLKLGDWTIELLLASDPPPPPMRTADAARVGSRE